MRGKEILFSTLVLLVAVGSVIGAGDSQVPRLPAPSKAAVEPGTVARDANHKEAAKPPAGATSPERVSLPEPKRSEDNAVVSNEQRGNPGHGDRGRGDWENPPRGGYGNDDHRGRGERHENWRRSRYRGSWDFLFFHGPILFPVPVPVPYVVRLPRYNLGVYVLQTGSDIVGSNFAYSLRERLRDLGLRMVNRPEEATLELYLVSMDEDPENPGLGSAVSVSYIWYPGYRFITTQMLDVGSLQIEALAASVAAQADQMIEQYR